MKEFTDQSIFPKMDEYMPGIDKPFIDNNPLKGNFRQGWVCPKCGAVLNPDVQFCSCSMKVTCGTIKW